MAKHDTRIDIRAQDNASPVLDKLNAKLNNWYRENRKEERLQKALYNESKDAITAVGTALTVLGSTGDKEMKRISDAVNAGYMSFQGFSAILGTMGAIGTGPVGIAIAGIGALAVAMARFTDGSEEATNAVNKFLEGLKIEDVDTWDNAIRRMETKLKGLQTTLDKQTRTVVSEKSGLVTTQDLLGYEEMNDRLRDQIKILDAGVKRAKELREALKLTGDVANAFGTTVEQGVNAVANPLVVLGKQMEDLYKRFKDPLATEKELIEAQKEINRLAKEYEATEERIQNAAIKKKLPFVGPMPPEPELYTGFKMTPMAIPGVLTGVKQPEAVRAIDSAKIKWSELTAMEQGFTTSMLSGVMSIANEIESGIGQAWENIFGEANSLLEIFTMNMIQSIGRIAAELASRALLASLINLIPGAGGIAAFIAPFLNTSSSSGATGTEAETNSSRGRFGTSVNVTINAVDAQSVRNWIARPEVSKVFADAITNRYAMERYS